MSNGQKIIELATAEIGYSRRPATTGEIAGYAVLHKITLEEARKLNLQWNKFGDWFGLQYVPYCMQFCCKMYSDAGFPIKGDWAKGFASVPNALKHFTESNELTQYPQAGDLVIFDWNGDKNPEHVGIFVSHNNNGTINTIEGNTSDSNPSNGGCVEPKIRKLTLVEAFIHPKILDKETLNGTSLA